MADILTDALTGLNYTPADTGFGMTQQTLSAMTPQLITPYTSTGRAVGIGLGSILLQSLLGYQARQQAAQDTLAVNSLANQLQTLETPQARTDFIKGVGDTGYQSRLSNLATALTNAETTTRLERAKKIADLQTAAEFELGPIGAQLAEAKAKRDADKQVQEMFALGKALETSEGKAGLSAMGEVSRAKGLGAWERLITSETGKNTRQANAFANLSPKQLDDATAAARTATSLQTLKKELEDLSWPQIKTMVTTGISPADKPGLAARFEQVQQLYRRPEFGATLTGNELTSSDVAFGKNLAATKEDMLQALGFLSNSQFDKAELTIQGKREGPEALLSAIQEARQTGKLTLPMAQDKPMSETPLATANIEQDIAKLEAVLANPKVSEATKAAAQAKINELLGE